MSNDRAAPVPAATLRGSVRDFRHPKGANLLERTQGFFDWQDERRKSGLWPYGRATEAGPRRHVEAIDDSNNRSTGVNFASQDYLSLSGAAEIREVAHAAIDEFGVHSAGSPALVGNTSLSIALERRIADFLHAEEAIVYPTGWAAGYGVIKGLVRGKDHIVMDALSHACLQDGAAAATTNIHLFRHNNLEHARSKLEKIRSTDTENGILVITEGLFSMDSDVPDIAAMQDLARDFGATLLVDVAHDLGSMGEGGRGFIGMQGMLGQVDLVMGSFSKTFASNGGFVACRDRKLKEYLRYYSSPNTFSNAMSPIQSAVVLKAFDIVDSAVGEGLRKSLMSNIRLLRELLTQSGFEVYGEASPIVCVKMGTEGMARLVSRRLIQTGLVANLVEYPAVPKGQARFRMQVMAGHTALDVMDAVHRLGEAYAMAQQDQADIDAGRAPTLAPAHAGPQDKAQFSSQGRDAEPAAPAENGSADARVA